MVRRLLASRLVEWGNAVRSRRSNLASRLYRLAHQADPDWATPLYNLGLVYKYDGRWAESLAHNLKAASLNPEDEAAWWNAGIAATALQDWRSARTAWRAYGLDYEEGTEPIPDREGWAAVRLNPDDDGEVVWVTRLDPARARIENVPFPASGFCFGDVLLHDGAPAGERVSNGETFPVFNCLGLWRASRVSTWTLEMPGVFHDRIDAIQEALARVVHRAECWTSTVRWLCRQCSEGLPHDEHDSDLPPALTHALEWGLAVEAEDPFLEIRSALLDVGIEEDFTLAHGLDARGRGALTTNSA